MHLELNATGTKEKVINAIRTQINTYRGVKQQSAALLSALADDVASRITATEGEEVSVVANIVIECTTAATPQPEAPKVVALPKAKSSSIPVDVKPAS